MLSQKNKYCYLKIRTLMLARGCCDPDFHISLSVQTTSYPGEQITVLCWSEVQTEAEIIL